MNGWTFCKRKKKTFSSFFVQIGLQCFQFAWLLIGTDLDAWKIRGKTCIRIKVAWGRCPTFSVTPLTTSSALYYYVQLLPALHYLSTHRLPFYRSPCIYIYILRSSHPGLFLPTRWFDKKREREKKTRKKKTKPSFQVKCICSCWCLKNVSIKNPSNLKALWNTKNQMHVWGRETSFDKS